jgi:hypothetical protein
MNEYTEPSTYEKGVVEKLRRAFHQCQDRMPYAPVEAAAEFERRVQAVDPLTAYILNQFAGIFSSDYWSVEKIRALSAEEQNKISDATIHWFRTEQVQALDKLALTAKRLNKMAEETFCYHNIGKFSGWQIETMPPGQHAKLSGLAIGSMTAGQRRALGSNITAKQLNDLADIKGLSDTIQDFGAWQIWGMPDTERNNLSLSVWFSMTPEQRTELGRNDGALQKMIQGARVEEVMAIQPHILISMRADLRKILLDTKSEYICATQINDIAEEIRPSYPLVRGYYREWWSPPQEHVEKVFAALQPSKLALGTAPLLSKKAISKMSPKQAAGIVLRLQRDQREAIPPATVYQMYANHLVSGRIFHTLGQRFQANLAVIRNGRSKPQEAKVA